MRRIPLGTATFAVLLMGGASLSGPALAKRRPAASPAARLADKPLQTPSKRQIVEQTRVAPTATGTAGVKVFRDPTTGAIREATPEEEQALETGRNRVSIGSPEPLRQFRYSDGTVAIELNDDYMVDVVVERAADGSLKTTCLPAGERRALPPPATSSAPTTQQLETK